MYFVKRNEEKRNLIDDFQNSFLDSFFTGKVLKTDIIENEKDYTLSVEMPGVLKKDINLEFNNQYLTISVNQENEQEQSNKKYIRKERSSYSYSRSYYLDKADEKDIKARLDNGILTIIINKIQEEKPKKNIFIE